MTNVPRVTRYSTPTPSASIVKSLYTFNIPANWTKYNYPEYTKLSDQLEFPPDGMVAISNKNLKCSLYIGTNDIGRGGPSEILDNFEVLIDNVKFNKRSWYETEGGKPFFSYYFCTDPKQLGVTIYSWTPDQTCINDIDYIVKSIKFE